MEQQLVEDGGPVYFVRYQAEDERRAWKVPASDGLTAVALTALHLSSDEWSAPDFKVLSVTPVMVDD